MLNALYTIYDVISQIGGFFAFILILFAVVKFWKESDEEDDE